MRFLIVSPVKNEGEYIDGLIQSMKRQTLLPLRWVIVDDGSTDDTVEIVRSHQKECPWISLEFTNDSAVRSGGSKVVRAFNQGYDIHKESAHDIIMKLDGDLTLPEDYLESIAKTFESDPKVGLCGGYCIIPENGEWVRETSAAHHVRGALKSYRRECFEEIGGFIETWNWDGLDNMMTMKAGWKVVNIEKAVKHHRPTSAAYEPLQHARRSGEEAYRTGNDLLITLIRTVIKMKESPYVIAGMHYLHGYIRARVKGVPRVVDKELARFINRFQYKRIVSMK